MPSVLILTTTTGGGHVSLAEALRDLLEPYADVEVADPFPDIASAHYRFVSRHAPRLWAAEYALTDGPRRAKLAHSLWTPTVRRPLRQVLLQRDYDLIVTTYQFLSAQVTRSLNRLGRPLPLVMLLTDPCALHAAWLSERRKATTLAPTSEIYRMALDAGFPQDRLRLSGWPVRRQFTGVDRGGRAATLSALGLDPALTTLFVQGGGDGAAGFARTVNALLGAAPGRVQVLLAAGTNTALAERFRGMPGVRVIPFTRQIAPYMAACDLVVGKAGPNTLFEATTLGLPFLATTYNRGQERDNLAFIERHGLGWVAMEGRGQAALIADLVNRPERLAAVRSSVHRYRVWNGEATAGIVPTLLDLAGDRRMLALEEPA